MAWNHGGNALVARGLYKSYGLIKAVQGVDLHIAQGECLALLGPNGAGKTTTVEILEGLTIPDQGEVEIGGLALVRDRREIMQFVGVLLQETNLYKRYSVHETLTMFGAFFEKSVDPDQIIQRLSLADKRDTQLRHLSGGQKQRVGLGCALVSDPKLLFLDEPTTGLDPQARRAIWDLMLQLKTSGKSILLTTHYMEEAEVVADRVAIMDAGKIIAMGTPKQLIRDVMGGDLLLVECGGEVLWAVDQLKSRLSWLSSLRYTETGCEVVVDDVAEKLSGLMMQAAALDIEIKRLEVRRGTLEDVFLRLTGRSLRDG
jgi:ABC-2 type transport system ATP-binding protein